MTDRFSPLAYAIAYARKGLPVLPCGQDKKPLIREWGAAATTNEAIILGWFQKWPDAMIGLLTGARSGLFVIDSDRDRENGESTGEATLAALGDAAFSAIDAAPRATTPSGGRHRYFQWPGEDFRNSAGRLGQKVDTRGDGGFIIAPGSINGAGAYAWDGPNMFERPPPPLPDAVCARLLSPARKNGQPKSRSEARAGSKWAEAAFAQELAGLAGAREGERNATLNRAAFSLGQIVAGGGLSQDRVETALEAAALALGLGRDEMRATIASGLNAGAKEPRAPADYPSWRPGSPSPDPNAAPETPLGWPAPDMTLAAPERGEPPPLPLRDLLSPRWADWVEIAAKAKGAPVDYVFAALIATAGSAIGNARWPSPWGGWSEPPIVWPMLIGHPSSGKSPGLDAVVIAMRRIEDRLYRDFETEHADWEAREEATKIARDAWKAKATEAHKAGKPAPEKPTDSESTPEPRAERLLIGDSTIEALGMLLARQPKGVLQYRDELAGWLGNMSRYSNGGSDRPFWLEAYGGRAYTIDRAARGVLRIPHVTVGIVGGIQPDKLSSLLLRSEDDGLLARFLPFWPNPVAPTRPEAAHDDRFLEDALDQLRRLAMQRDDEGSLRPWFVPFDDPAQALLQEYRLASQAACAEASGLLASFIGKAPGFVVRLSLTLAYLDWAIGDPVPEPQEIGAKWVGLTAHFVEAYALPMAQRAYAEASVPPAERAAQSLARRLIASGPETVSVRAIQRQKLAGLRDAAEIKAALLVLVEAGWAKLETEATKGRERTIYRLNPALRAAA